MWSTNGTKTGYITCGSSYTVIDIANYSAPGSVDIDNFSAKALTDCAATGALIVSTLGGSTRSWTSVDTGFNPNLACTYEIYDVSLAAIADGESDIYIYDSAGAFLKATMKAQGSGETLGAEQIGDPGFDGGWWSDPKGYIVAGKLHFDGTSSGTAYRVNREFYGLYKYGYTIENYVSGYGYMNYKGRVMPDKVENGTYTSYHSAVEPSDALYIGTSAEGGNAEMDIDNATVKQVLTPSTDGVTLQASKWDTTENFGIKGSGFKYNEASYAVRVYKVRG